MPAALRREVNDLVPASNIELHIPDSFGSLQAATCWILELLCTN